MRRIAGGGTELGRLNPSRRGNVEFDFKKEVVAADVAAEGNHGQRGKLAAVVVPERDVRGIAKVGDGARGIR